MSNALHVDNRTPAVQPVVTLRTLLEQRRAAGERFHLGEVVAIVVPICTELAALHDRGERPFVHPSSIGAGPDGVPRILPKLAARPPTDTRDQAALAPELRGPNPTVPSPRTSVFGVGAVVYEMLTLVQVGPGMKPPSQIVRSLPPMVDTILSKALATSPYQRPDDLPAFAQAIHHFAPSSIAPPPAVEDHSFDLEVDVSMPTPPPAPSPISSGRAAIRPASDDPFGVAVDLSAHDGSVKSSQHRATEELASLKARLEADRTPRWMIVKDKMDHGPFAAIELLQQIASHAFLPDHELVNIETGSRSTLKDHPEFSRFAHHAHLHREEVKEHRAVVAAEKREKAAGATKFVVGALAVVALLGVLGFVVYRIQKSRAEAEERRREEEALVISGEGSIKARSVPKPKVATGGGGGGGGYGGRSYEEAMAKNVSGSEDDVLGPKECAAPIGGDIAAACGLNGKATAKVWVQRGRAQGVSVVTDPPQPGVNGCMASRIAGLSWRNMPGGSGCIRTFTVH